MSNSRDEKREESAMLQWINHNDDTLDVCTRYQHDFIFLFTRLKQCISEYGIAKYRDMSDADVEKHCEALTQRNEEARNTPDENGCYHIPIWDADNEKDMIVMIKALAELSSEDRNIILTSRTFLDNR